ncbi:MULTISPECIES: hypothetical protein [Legionella]|uniref:Uncharacterized protein n=1 Tax=Legionella resiliens TaxID=2905958 RepID=A0ABS8X7T3_9GAMM|nr:MULTISPECIES: hypothetical protein [unclassified Legionella]MCE0724400.1 hypothetical protein [Legionella sp. 9fVS26]MCE3533552.1 hypothetical protein [Legionella sp. 8cVS16]QLZ69741.1 hypothetical protein FOLKNPGA_02539 [Legionella sp. PC1000]
MMMLFRKFATSSFPRTVKPSSAPSRFFKNIDWSIVKKSEAEAELNKSVKTIVKELENTSSTDAPGPAPRFK